MIAGYGNLYIFINNLDILYIFRNFLPLLLLFIYIFFSSTFTVLLFFLFLSVSLSPRPHMTSCYLSSTCLTSDSMHFVCLLQGPYYCSVHLFTLLWVNSPNCLFWLFCFCNPVFVATLVLCRSLISFNLLCGNNCFVEGAFCPKSFEEWSRWSRVQLVKRISSSCYLSRFLMFLSFFEGMFSFFLYLFFLFTFFMLPTFSWRLVLRIYFQVSFMIDH